MTTTPKSTPETPDAAIMDAPAPTSDAIEHDRAVTNIGTGRVTFKGHNAKGGYPFRIYDGAVQALVDGEWVIAEDSTPI